MIKNTAGQKWVVFAVDLLERIPMLGDAANITATISKDGGSYVALDDTNPVELGEGRYVFDLTQAETNCDRFHIYPVSSTASVVVGNEEGNYTTEVRPSNTAIAAAVRTELATELSRIDVAVSTRMPAGASFTTNLTETPLPSRIVAFVGETRTFTIATVDGLGNPVDCSALTLEVVIEKLDRTDVVTIANAAITKTSTTVAFSVANTYHTTEANYRWALRRTDTGVVIMHGPYVVQYAADN